ncbi:hypothetical protein Tco_0287518 [Tanacetum coccineum]
MDIVPAAATRRDTIQLENTVSTISQEYLLEFTSEYGIPDGLHLELPALRKRSWIFQRANDRRSQRWMSFSKRPGKNTPQCYTKPLNSLKNWNNRFFWVDERIFPTIVDWHTNALKDGMPAANSYSAPDAVVLNTHHMDLFNLISAQNPTKVKTAARPRAAHEVPLLTVTANHVIDMEDAAMASESSETPSTIEKSPLDFANEDPPQIITKRGGTEDKVQDDLAYKIPLTRNASTTGVALEIGLEEEVAAMGPPVNKRRRKRGNNEAEENAPPKVLRRDHDTFRPAQRPFYCYEKCEQSRTAVLCEAATAPRARHCPIFQGTATQIPTEDVATAEVNVQFSVGSLESERSTFVPFMVRSPGGIYQPGWGVTNECRLDAPDACQDIVDHIVPPGYFSELHHLPNADFLSQYNINLARQVAMGSQLKLRFEQEVKLLKKIRAVESEVHGLQNQTKNLKTLLEAEVTGKEKIKAAFEEFKKHKDDKAEQRCTEMDACLDKLSMDLDEERLLKILVYPEVRDPKDPWAVKEEMMLEDAITANISRAEKKKKCRVGLAILLADAATQTEAADKEEEPHPRLHRSISLPPVYNL